MKTSKIATAVVVVALLLSALPGCQQKPKGSIDPSDVEYIAKLATLECTYHNVAHMRDEAWSLPINFVKAGYKELWFEYDATAKMGIDVAQVTVSEPDDKGVVTIAVPDAKLLDDQVDVHEETMGEFYTDKGPFAEITDDDRKQALSEAQDKALEKARNDKGLKKWAKERAKSLLEQYVVNVGKTTGQQLTVEFVDVEQN